MHRSLIADRRTFRSAAEAAAFCAGDDAFKLLAEKEVKQSGIAYNLQGEGPLPGPI